MCTLGLTAGGYHEPRQQHENSYNNTCHAAICICSIISCAMYPCRKAERKVQSLSSWCFAHTLAIAGNQWSTPSCNKKHSLWSTRGSAFFIMITCECFLKTLLSNNFVSSTLTIKIFVQKVSMFVGQRCENGRPLLYVAWSREECVQRSRTNISSRWKIIGLTIT